MCVHSRARLFVTPRTVAHQAPLYMRFSREEYWSGVPFPPPRHPPDPGIEPSLALAGGLFTAGSPGQPQITSATDDHTFSSSESPVSQLRWTLRHHLQGVDLVKGGLLWLSTWSGYVSVLLYLCVVERCRDSAGQGGASQVAQVTKNRPADAEDPGSIPG